MGKRIADGEKEVGSRNDSNYTPRGRGQSRFGGGGDGSYGGGGGGRGWRGGSGGWRGGSGGWRGRGRGGGWDSRASSTHGGYQSDAHSDNPNRHPMVNARVIPGLDPSTALDDLPDSAKRSRPTKEDIHAKKRKKWRLIVRNLPFTVTEDALAAKFRPYGKLVEVTLPTKKNMKGEDVPRGFGFIQFDLFPDAYKALKELNATNFDSRPMALDWAIPKDDYDTAKSEEHENDELPNSTPAFQGSKKKVFHDEEDDETEPVNENGKAEEELSHTSSSTDVDEEEKEDGEDASEDEEDASEDEEEEEEFEKKHKKKIAAKAEKEAQNQRPDPAVEEGRTVFVRNLSFDTTKEDFAEFARKFGDIKYALICMYPDSEHSKGSGFIQFKNAADAQKLIEAAVRDEATDEGGVKLDGRWLNVTKALSRKEATTKEELRKKDREKTAKDKRNLHLMRLSIIRPGTEAANNMSENDAKKRVEIQAAAKAKIENLHIFVSPTRLCIHNIPATVSDERLRQLVLASVKDKKVRLKECRIMRDRDRIVNKTQGEGKSRGFAFVEWEQHEHALACLRHLNNNPSVFTDAKRPIVEFSLENLVALNKKKERLEKSRQKLAEKTKKTEDAVSSEGPKPLSKKKRKRLETTKASSEALAASKASVQKSGQKPLPSHFGPKIRHRKREAKEASETEPTKKKKKKEAASSVASEPAAKKGKKAFWRTSRKERRVKRRLKAQAQAQAQPQPEE